MQKKNTFKLRKDKGKTIRVVLFSVFTYSLSIISAQEAISVSSGNSSGSGGSVSYSIGLDTYTTNAGSLASIAQGIQQPYEIMTLTGIAETKGVDISISVYPNPTPDYLTLEIDKTEIPDMLYQLYDNNGKLLQTAIIKDNKTSVAFNYLATGSYFLKVLKRNMDVKTFIIIKN